MACAGRGATVLSLLIVFLVAPALIAATTTIDIDVNKPGVAIPPGFFGLMTEEINHSYDGGLFAELIQNRTFQDDRKAPAHWSAVGGATLAMTSDDPVNSALPVSLHVDFTGDGSGVANDGFWGIPVHPGTTYTASFYAKGENGFEGPVTASIILNDGNAVVAKAAPQSITSSWKKYSVTLQTGADAPVTAKANFVLSASGAGAACFSLVSLFPPTYQDVPGGLRPDLMQLMADMHPSFIRLPGGNYVEGNTFPTRFNWLKMIGPADTRPGHMGCWSYRSSDGFGMPQYLLWCKQLNAEPVLALFAGYTLNHDHVEAGPDLKPYVDEALEEIEYVSGDATTQWGKQRAADGFTEPFALHYVEAGNEDWFDRSGSYDGRFAQFFDAIRAKYPSLKVIATAPVKSRTPDLIDDHYYRSAAQMARDWRHYEKSDRSGPKIFVGEWATQEGRPTPNLHAALADAVWLMGLERDSDKVQIECYAPLFVNVNPGAWQWHTNLIGYDALHSFGSPSYYAQCMFGQNKADRILPTELTAAPATSTASTKVPHGAIGLGTWHTQADYKDIVITGPDGQELLKPDLSGDASAWKTTGSSWQVHDQMLSPTNDAETWAITGDPAWTDYTIHLKARKNSGAEGFLILFHALDNQNYHWWNIGGWGNTKTQCEAGEDNARTQYGPSSRFTVNTGQWYDLKLEVHGGHVRGYVDDKLVTDASDESALSQTLFASASYISSTHEVVLKVVNFASDPVEATINLKGAASVQADGKAIVLTGEPKDMNSVDAPTKVAPKEERMTDAAASFHRTFAPSSLTLLRIGAQTP
jgi:alpha-N-arabinofuranosidase